MSMSGKRDGLFRDRRSHPLGRAIYTPPERLQYAFELSGYSISSTNNLCTKCKANPYGPFAIPCHWQQLAFQKHTVDQSTQTNNTIVLEKTPSLLETILPQKPVIPPKPSAFTRSKSVPRNVLMTQRIFSPRPQPSSSTATPSSPPLEFNFRRKSTELSKLKSVHDATPSLYPNLDSHIKEHVPPLYHDQREKLLQEPQTQNQDPTLLVDPIEACGLPLYVPVTTAKATTSTNTTTTYMF